MTYTKVFTSIDHPELLLQYYTIKIIRYNECIHVHVFLVDLAFCLSKTGTIEPYRATVRLLSTSPTLHRRTGVGGKSVFELKTELEKECSPFFYHYTKIDHTKVSFTTQSQGTCC